MSSAFTISRDCACGWSMSDCDREQNLDGDASGHERRIEDREAEHEHIPHSKRQRIQLDVMFVAKDAA